MFRVVALQFILTILFIQQATCQVQSNEGRAGWLIPQEKVFEGGPPKDGIPALTSPVFIPVNEAGYLHDDDLVIGMLAADGSRAYPHAILDWHEIINDSLSNKPVSLTYCPLTGSGIAWKGEIGQQTTTFGVSGLLYSTNLIAYDRSTGSYWSQMRLQCVGGKLKGTEASLIPTIETTWKTWKEWFPESKVVSTNTGYDRRYGEYPYGPYKTADYLLFDVDHEDPRLPKKERVLGVLVKGKARVYRLGDFSPDRPVKEDEFEGLKMVIAGSSDRNFAVAYLRTIEDGTVLEFRPPEGESNAVMTDTGGTSWDVFGRGIEGPRKGKMLRAVPSFIAYWFAWAAFHPDLEIADFP